MRPTLFPQTLPKNTAHALLAFKEKQPHFLQSFYLSGGTALSLQLGHRESDDLDFFTETPFNPQHIEQQLTTFGRLSQTELSEGTLNTYLDKVKLQFLLYPYPMIEPYMKWESILLSSVSDIACTKLQTVSMRGSKKDFVDLYFLLQKNSLETLFSLARKKYATSNYNETHILKSLVYFSDAEKQPMPKLHKQVSWEEIKESIVSSVKSTVFL